MQRIIIVFVLVLTFGFQQHAAAQRHGGPERGAQLIEQLDLTEQQTAQVRALREAQRAKVAALRAREFTDQRERFQAMRALREAGRAEMDAILTETQRAELRTLIAERRAERPKVDRQALRNDVQSYRKENIKPVMRAQRAKLEPLLSAADKALIAELRPKAEVAKRELRAGMRALKEQRSAGERPDRERLRAQRKALETKYAAEIEQVETLVEKYRLDIDRLLGEVEDQHALWKEELRDITREHVGERGKHRPGSKGHRAHPEGAHPGKHRPGGQAGRARMENLHKAHFLLMQPARPAEPAQTDGRALGVFPNPATDQLTLRYDLAADGPVQIVLKNAEGKQLRTVLSEHQGAGKQRLTVDVSALTGGVYYLHLKQGDDVRTQQFVVGSR